MTLCGIYQIRNTINGHRYIGQSVDILGRLMHHRAQMSLGNGRNPRLQAAWNKYGEAAFEFSVLAALDPPVMKRELTDLEQDYVDFFWPEYNICRECVESQLGTKRNPEQRARMARPRTKKMPPRTPEFRAMISIRQTGNKNCLGKICPPERRAKISASLRGHSVSQETRARQAIAKKGKPWTPARRAALAPPH